MPPTPEEIEAQKVDDQFALLAEDAAAASDDGITTPLNLLLNALDNAMDEATERWGHEPARLAFLELLEELGKEQ